MVFGGNDRPGVMLASAVAHLCQSLRRCPGQSASRSSPPATTAGARRMTAARPGVEVAAVVDARSEVAGSPAVVTVRQARRR